MAKAGRAGDSWRTLTAYTPAFTSWDGKLYESELVRAAIDARARHISKLSVELQGSARPQLAARLRQRPNAFQTWSQYLYRLSTILDMQTTAFIVPVLDRAGEVSGLFPVLPDRCEVVESGGAPWLRYRFSSGQVGAVEMERCGIMTRFQYRDDLFGSSNRALDTTMELISLQGQAVQEAVTNSATYRFMARVSNFTAPEDLAKERKRFSEQNFADENNGLLLFPNTYSDIKQIESKPYTVDKDELSEIRRNVYNYFGVNEEVLQNKVFGDEWDAFYEGAIEPWAVQASEVHTSMLFTRREQGYGNRFMLSSNRLQFMSASDKLKVSAQMADRGIMNRDEIRSIWNLPPLPEGAGQAYTIRGEYYLLGADGTIQRTRKDVEEEVEEISEEIAEESGE